VEVIRLNGPPVIWAVGPASDGWILANIVAPGMPPGSPRDEIATYWFNSSGEFVSDVARVKGIRRVSIPGSMAAEAFSPSVHFGVWNNQIYIGETLQPVIRVVDSSGNPARTIRWEAQAVTPSAALDDVEAVLRSTPVLSTSRVQEILQAPLPDSVPVFTDLLIDQDGFLWIRPYVPARDATVLGGTVGMHRTNRGGEWLVFGRTGNRVATVALPEDLEPYQITSTGLVGIARDELGVESVRVHRISRR
jgi:hypothetical protein